MSESNLDREAHRKILMDFYNFSMDEMNGDLREENIHIHLDNIYGEEEE